MVRIASVVLAVATVFTVDLAAPPPAAAQHARPATVTGPRPPPIRIDQPQARGGVGFRNDYDDWVARSNGSNIPPQSIERVDLANRMSVLIELGRCREARDMANEAGERQMALSVRQLCDPGSRASY